MDEVGVAFGVPQNLVPQVCLVEAVVPSGFGDAVGESVGGVQDADRRELEESLGIRFGVARQFGDLWQSCSHEGDRQLSLDHLVERFDDSLELLPAEELDLIEEENYSAAPLGGCLANGEEHVGQIHGQVLVVGVAFSGLDIQSRAPCPARIHGDGEGLQDRGSVLEPLAPPGLGGQLEQGCPQATRHVTPKGRLVVLADFKLDHHPVEAQRL